MCEDAHGFVLRLVEPLEVRAVVTHAPALLLYGTGISAAAVVRLHDTFRDSMPGEHLSQRRLGVLHRALRVKHVHDVVARLRLIVDDGAEEVGARVCRVYVGLAGDALRDGAVFVFLESAVVHQSLAGLRVLLVERIEHVRIAGANGLQLFQRVTLRPKRLPLLTRVGLGGRADLDRRIDHHFPPAGIRHRIIGALLSEQLASQIILMPACKDDELPGVVV